MASSHSDDFGPCKYVPYCAFFNDRMPDMPAMAESMKTRFCKGNYSVCARFRVMEEIGKAYVDSNLFPSHAERADQLIASIKDEAADT